MTCVAVNGTEIEYDVIREKKQIAVAPYYGTQQPDGGLSRIVPIPFCALTDEENQAQ